LNDAGTELDWNKYSQVSADELRLLHGGQHATGPKQKAYVSIGRRDDWNVCSLPVHRGFDNYLPNFIESLLADVLEEDSFATMNSMFRPGHRDCRHPTLRGMLGPDDNPLKEGYRKADGIARLNACWVDVDCYKLGLTHGQVIGQVYDLQRDRKIPTPSYFKDSGRGLWIVWLLGKETRSFREHVSLWRRIQTQLCSMFTAADRNAGNDPSRLSRIVGSVNSKTEDDKRATYVVFGKGTDGQPIRYELADLAKRLNIDLDQYQRRRVTSSGTVTLTAKQKGWKGQHQRWKLDEDRFWLLVETLRRTVPVGTRNAHHLVIGGILRLRYKYEPDAIHNALEDAAQRLWKHHPRTDKEYSLELVRKEIKHAAFGRQAGVMLTGQTIADKLALTTDEAERIRDLIPTNSKGTWPPATGQEPITRTLTRPERRERIIRYLAEHHWLPGLSDQEATTKLAEDTGLEVSRETVRRLRNAHLPPKPTPELRTPPLPLADDATLPDFLVEARRRHGLEP
jgi:hypothetical protein